MNTEKVIVFSSNDENNTHKLIGILHSYQVPSELVKVNDSFQISVDVNVQTKAEAIIAKYERKPGEQNDLLKLVFEFTKKFKLTAFLLLLMSGIFALTHFGENLNQVSKLFITDVNYVYSVKDNTIRKQAYFDVEILEVWGGQIWRLFSNGFIHNNLIHFLINFFLILQLGKMVEKNSGIKSLAALVIVSLPVSSIGQYIYTYSPIFGGMNGVIMTLFGFLAVRSKFDTRYFGQVQGGYYFVLAVWFVIGFLKVFHINLSYGALAGLLLGVVWGYLSCRLLPTERLISPKKSIL